MPRRRLVVSCIILGLCLSACANRQHGAFERGFSSGGRSAFQAAFAPPLTLASTGSLRVAVPADVLPNPNAAFTYALFSDPGQEMIDRQAHAVVSEVDRYSWRWEKESFALPQAVFYSTLLAGGRNWTVQILPVDAESDWFGQLWRENGRQTPAFWLAKRWSSTPDDDIRVVVEYRERAPLCLEERLQSAAESARRDKNARAPGGEELLHGCQDQISDFSARADAAVDLSRDSQAPLPAADAPVLARPGKSPKLGKLVGRVEQIPHGGIGSYF
ncbi:MAG: DUF4851 domain-containing protein [Desulfovibrio sp.]|jgi:hypothetical protein|nr:DUF4851 domain-containing protein [Desulfovibrio sp.]